MNTKLSSDTLRLNELIKFYKQQAMWDIDALDDIFSILNKEQVMKLYDSMEV